MIHHLILVGENADLHLTQGKLISGSRKIAVAVLGSVQCFATTARWSQSALESLASQCPVIMARWDKRTGKWATFSLAPRGRYVNPNALSALCRIHERHATQLASDLLFTKVSNQHLMLRIFDPSISPLPKLKQNSFAAILRLESKYARFFWAKYFAAASADLFAREKRKASHPLNVALNYGYGFLYHAIEWQCLASGLDPTVGIIHRLRRNRPSLACDLIEPFRCCVELTIIKHLDQIHEKSAMAARFAAMLEEPWSYRGQRFRLRSIIRLVVESFAAAVTNPKKSFHPFALHARDACL
jgi:CRISPR-associated endonuclease Cas1